MVLDINGHDLVAIISATAALVAAIGTLRLQVKASAKLDRVHDAVNGASAELNALTPKSAFAEGVLSTKAPTDKPTA